MKILSGFLHLVSEDDLGFVLADNVYHSIKISSELLLERRTDAKYNKN